MTNKDIALAIGLVFLMSVNLIVQKIAVEQVSIFVLSFLRVAMVIPLIFLYPKPKRSLWLYSLCGFFIFSLYYIVLNLGLKQVGANVTSFIVQLQVFFGILAFYFILGEKPTWVQSGGIFISFMGVYFLSATSSQVDFPLMGVLFLIASCVSYGIGAAFTKKYVIGNSIEDMVWMGTASSVPLFFACLIFEGPSETINQIINITWPAFFAAAYGAIGITLVTVCLWTKLLLRAPASSVLPFTLLMPLFAIIFSKVILEETLTFHQMIAGFIILLGVMFAQKLHLRIPILFFWIKKRIA